MNLLLVDIGNTRAKWRLARATGDDVDAVGPNGAVALADVATLDVAWRTLPARPDAVFVSNVASPACETAVRAAATAAWPGVPVRPVHAVASQCGVTNGYHDPSRLGPDRWLSLIAAHALVPGRSALVCGFGTATTIDLLEAGDDPHDAARFVGGLILPGVDTMRRALSTSTARLPLAAGRIVDFADRTDDAIESGIACAQAGAVERAWGDACARAARRERPPPAACVVGGGAAAPIAALLSPRLPVTIPHDLVLRGLGLVAFATLADERARTPPPARST